MSYQTYRFDRHIKQLLLEHPPCDLEDLLKHRRPVLRVGGDTLQSVPEKLLNELAFPSVG